VPIERSNPGAVVELRGVTKRYSNGTVAVSNLDLAVRAGEFLSLLGPSGCGKTTVLRMIAGLAEVSAGSVDLPALANGKEGRGLHDIGFVFQEATLMPWATALQNVMLPLKLKHVDAREATERAEAALASVGLESFRHAYPRELSGGMKMRVSIARALVTAPRILLMDEPFAALDEITRHKLNDDLLALWAKERFTVVFVTHSVFESVYLSQRIVVMAARPGRVIADIANNASLPHDPSYRTSPEYASTCHVVSDKLLGAIAA
jgi:NitT/TauT family transport system ATP-binding protein